MADSTKPETNSPDTDDLKKDIERLRQDLSALAASFKQRANEQAHAGADRVREQFRDMAQEAEQCGRKLTDEIEARPFASVFAAFGVGLLLGRIFSR